MLRLFPAAALLLLIGPVAAGILGILLPAFGYLPALGRATASLEPFRDLIAMPGLARSAFLSLGTGLAATAIVFTVVMAFIAGWRETRAFAALQRLVSPLLSVPHAAAAFGLAFLAAPSGFFFRLAAPIAGWENPPDLLIVQDRAGIALAAGLIMKEIPFLFLMTLAALPHVRAAEMGRVAASLGYGRMLGFLHAAGPALYRQIRLAVFAVLAFSTSVVDMALILGPTTPAPLAVRILAWRNDPNLDMHLVAAAGAVLQVGVTALALLVWIAGEQAFAALAGLFAGSGWRARSDFPVRLAALVMMSVASGAVLAGVALLAVWSTATAWRFPDILPESVSLAAWMRLAPSLAGPFANTLALAALSSLAAVALAIGSLESQARGVYRIGPALRLLYVPLVTPAIAFLFGLQVLFAVFAPDGPFAVLLLAHLVFVFPYVLLSLREPWQSFDPRYAQVIRALGRGENAVFWRVRLPMLIRPVLVAAALGFAVSVGLYLPTLLIGAGRWPTVTTETVALASGGDRRLIGATALVQALLPFLGFALAAMVPAALFRSRRRMRVAP
jgi:putative thiamine transport system permease protein